MVYAPIGLRQGGDGHTMAVRRSRSPREAERWNEAAAGDFEHRPVSSRPAPFGGAEQVAAGIGDQRLNRISAVSAVKGDQSGWRGGVAGCGGAISFDLEHRAEPCRK